ncbi:major facilitator superfamily MFS_1 [Gloeocapsa sp. PCC 7428]|uniref:MFS transporter n=1 Tax=Gloeocapsa sp. PCC 7428 TaxID=1173026 RepID=UPI0002A5BD9A|nr:MFS transporter [Gloeocapsa sp. PCC 7428]AFZ30466.1 major facilitator superfamily MFS_1 [Gloeocapsa sp. PCC 7428]
MNVFQTLDPQPRRNLQILFVAGLLFWSSLASLLPTLPLYISDIGGTPQQIGVVMGSFAIGLLTMRPWLAHLADLRSRKLVLIIALSAVALAPLGYLMVKSLWLLMVIRAFHGISIAAYSSGYTTLVADIAPAKSRGEIIGYMSLVNPLGMALGPALGGYLQASIGYTALFLLSAGLGILGILFASQVSNPVADLLKRQATDNRFWQLLGTPRIRTLALILLLVGLAFGTLSTFVPLYIKSVGVDFNVGLFYTAAAIASFIIRIPTGRASDRYGRGLFVTISLIFYTVSMLLLWLANGATAFLIAGFVEGLGAGILIPMVATVVADRTLPQERGRMFGLCMVGFDVGIAIAGPVLGAIAQQIGYRHLFGFAASLTALAIVVFLTQSSKDIPHSLRFALGKGRDVYALR